MNSKTYREILSKPIRLPNLIAVGSRLCQEIKEGKIEEEVAFRNLLTYAFDSAKEIIERQFTDLNNIEDPSYRELSQEPSNKNYELSLAKIRVLFLKPFKENNDRNASYLPNHSSIYNFKKNIVLYLKEMNMGIERINNFILQYNLSLSSKAEGDVHIRKFYKWWTNKEKVQDLVKSWKKQEPIRPLSRMWTR